MKAIFFLHYRAGSSIFQYYIGNTPRLLATKLQSVVKTDITFPINQPVKTIHTDIGSISNVVNHSTGNYIICGHMGNWWGNKPADEVPDAFDGNSPMRWGPPEIKQLIPKHKIITIVRNSKDQLLSFYHLKGGIEEQLRKTNHVDYWIALCKGWRNQIQVAQANQNTFPNHYKIMKYEDLVSDPIKFFEKLIDFIDDKQTLNKTILEERIDTGAIFKQYHSSKSKEIENWQSIILNKYTKPEMETLYSQV